MADPTAPQTTSLFGVPLNGQPAAPTGATPVAPKQYKEQDGKHRGVAGVARDILGTLGDFLLTRLHMPAMYAPAQRARKLSAAQANIDTDPVGSIQQVSSIDPVVGAKLRDQYIDNSRLAASQASTAEARDARLAQAAALQNEKNRNTSASYLGSLVGVPEADRANNYAAIRQRLLSRYGTSDPQLANDLPETYDPIAVDSFIDGAVPVGTQRSQRLQATRDAATDADRDAARGERVRHNTATEGQGDARISIARDRAATAGRPRPARATNVQSYTGEDGYKYTQRSDGTTVKSPTRVRPTGRGGATPAEGTRRVVNGHTYEIRGGKPVRVQ
jgi:hypothetical protein